MGRQSKSVSLFDIRIKGTDHDVVVVKGPATEASFVCPVKWLYSALCGRAYSN